MSQRVEIVSNIEPKKFGLNVRRYGFQPSIFVRSFSPITTLPHSSLAPPRNPPGELFIAQPVADIFQPLVGALPFQIGERFLQWHILAQCRQFAEKLRLSPVLR